MKTIFFSLALLCAFHISFAQFSNGLVAHWMFNGNTADSSGNGLNGIAHNASSATGMSGQPNTAYYFNGVNAYVGVPYKPQMNLSKYTIVSTLLIQGFYSDICQANSILSRGDQYIGSNPVNGTTPGAYGCNMMDQPYDDDCYIFDSTKFVFTGYGAEGANWDPTVWQYPANTPNVESQKWTRVAITFDSIIYKIYVDGQLINTVLSNAIAIGSSNDSINIGSNYTNYSIYPYWFNGLIDDMQLYSRALSDTEITQLNCSKFIALQPADSTVDIGTNVTFSTDALPNAFYTWQVNTGIGFFDVPNSPSFLGINTAVLTVVNPPLSMNSYTFRCIVTNGLNCLDTTNAANLSVNTPAGIEDILHSSFNIFPNPSNGSFTVSANMDYHLDIKDIIGRVVYQSECSKGLTELDLNLSKGVYSVSLYDDKGSRVGVRKVVIE